jgi:hypothetical protein
MPTFYRGAGFDVAPAFDAFWWSVWGHTTTTLAEMMAAVSSMWSLEELANLTVESVEEKQLRRLLQLSLPARSMGFESSSKVSTVPIDIMEAHLLCQLAYLAPPSSPIANNIVSLETDPIAIRFGLAKADAYATQHQSLQGQTSTHYAGGSVKG